MGDGGTGEGRAHLDSGTKLTVFNKTRVDALIPPCSSEQGNTLPVLPGWEMFAPALPCPGQGRPSLCGAHLGPSCSARVMGPRLGSGGWASPASWRQVPL